MGSSRHVYVGPYFRCVTPIVEEPFDIQGACPNKSCSNYGKQVYAQFCGKCGSKAATVQSIAKKAKVTEGEVRMALSSEDALNNMTNGSGPIIRDKDQQVHLWEPNGWPKGFSPPRKYDNAGWDGTDGEVQLQPDAIEREKTHLRNAFGGDYEVLERLYGKENVQVCWGIITYDY